MECVRCCVHLIPTVFWCCVPELAGSSLHLSHGILCSQNFTQMAKSDRSHPGWRKHAADSDDNGAGPSCLHNQSPDAQDAFSGLEDNGSDNGSENGAQGRRIGSEVEEEGDEELEDNLDGLGDGMDLEGFSGPREKVVKPLTPEALAAFKAAKEKTGVIYISRIPPGMRPTKVRHLMSQYGEVGKVYLQQEGEYTICHGPNTPKLIWHAWVFRCKEGISQT